MIVLNILYNKVPPKNKIITKERRYVKSHTLPQADGKKKYKRKYKQRVMVKKKQNLIENISQKYKTVATKQKRIE